MLQSIQLGSALSTLTCTFPHTFGSASGPTLAYNFLYQQQSGNALYHFKGETNADQLLVVEVGKAAPPTISAQNVQHFIVPISGLFIDPVFDAWDWRIQPLMVWTQCTVQNYMLVFDQIRKQSRHTMMFHAFGGQEDNYHLVSIFPDPDLDAYLRFMTATTPIYQAANLRIVQELSVNVDTHY